MGEKKREDRKTERKKVRVGGRIEEENIKSRETEIEIEGPTESEMRR